MQEVDISITDNRTQGDDSAVMSVVALSALVSAEQPSALSNLSYGNQIVNNDLAAKVQVAHQDALNRLRHSILADAVDRVQNIGSRTARAAVDVSSGNAAAQSLIDLKSAIDAFAARGPSPRPLPGRS
ncbi:MAG: hypothetical protein ACJ8IK_20435 [Burkholderiaceae bacterium]